MNCNFKSIGYASSDVFSVIELNSNTIKNILFKNINITFTDQPRYTNGLILLTATNTMFDGLSMKIPDTTTAVQQLRATSGKHILNNINFVSENATSSISISTNAKIYANFLRTTSRIIFGTSGDPKAILNYCEYGGIYNNTETNCKLNTFDMS